MFRRVEFFEGLGVQAVQTQIDYERNPMLSSVVAKEVVGQEQYEPSAQNNRDGLEGLVGKPIVWSKLKHTADFDHVAEPQPEGLSLVRDAVITNVSDSIGVGNYSADCATVLVFDPISGYMANIHSGWQGTRDSIVPKVVDNMQGLGAKPRNMHVWIGPSASVEQYEFGAEAPEWTVEYGENAGKFVEDRFHLNVLGILLVQLEIAGLKVEEPDRLGVDGRCTMEQGNALFSFRNYSKGAQNFDGRHALVIAPQ